MRIYGINPVLEALRTNQVTAIHVSDRHSSGERDRLADLVRVAEEQAIPVRRANAGELARLTDGGAHQGVVADVREQTTVSLADLIAGARGAALLVGLDQIEDPATV